MMLIKGCGNDMYGFVEEGLVWINMVDVEVMYDEEE